MLIADVEGVLFVRNRNFRLGLIWDASQQKKCIEEPLSCCVPIKLTA
jgi:hypothetical protein